MREITLDLSCDLTESEINERAQTISSTMLEYDSVEDAKKEATKEYSEQLKGLRGQMRELSKAIRRKSEIRPTVCLIRFHNPEVGMKRLIRKDTGEVVRDEQMTFEERQNNLFDDIGELNRLYSQDDQPTPPAA